MPLTTVLTNDRRGYSPKEIASQVGVSVSFVRKEIRSGRLRACKLGRRVVVLNQDLDEYLHGHLKKVAVAT